MSVNFREAAVEVNSVGTTTNGMVTFTSSLDRVVDFFFLAGASRGKDITKAFAGALNDNPELALRVALWGRDVRGGAGERNMFRQCLAYLEQHDYSNFVRVLPKVAEVGRWDDLLVAKTPLGREAAFDLIKAALDAGNGLAAKWMPRKGKDAADLRKHLGLNFKDYRKLLVNLTKVVETQMCARDWTNINYSHVPSVAAARYQKAFTKHDPNGYAQYQAGLVTGDTKVNAGAVYPYDVIRSMRTGSASTAEAQWAALPNYLEDGHNILPICDVSGSMTCAAGGRGSVTCLDVSVSLGLYLADRQKGAFANMFMTFSSNPKIQVLKGKTLAARMKELEKAEWGMSTNLEAAFNEVLKVAKIGRVDPADMPKTLLVISDMEFNSSSLNSKHNAFDMLRAQYKAAGYELPKVVWWNVNGRGGNVPVKYNEAGTALVSGFSPSIMTSIISAKKFTPVDVMLEAVMKPRYAV